MLPFRTPLILAFALLGALFLGGGCLGGDSEATSDLGPNSGGGAGEPEAPDDDGSGAFAQCSQPSDCVLAASSCCECPTFAAPVGEGYDAGCDEVDCAEPTGLCPAVEATCDGGECVMICSPIQTDKSCAFGFVRDDAGCLINECAIPELSQGGHCELDSDCVQIPADCCGCASGGFDRAAPISEAGALLDALNCPPNPACPGVNVCDETQIPRCITGTCVLADESMNPSPDPASIQLCGTPQLGACPIGSNCILNDVSAKEASDLGVGSCHPE